MTSRLRAFRWSYLVGMLVVVCGSARRASELSSATGPLEAFRAQRFGGSRRVRVDAAHPDGKLTDAEQRERVAAALAAIRGEGRPSAPTRLDAVRWLLEVAYGPPPEAHELAAAEDDTEEGDEP